MLFFTYIVYHVFNQKSILSNVTFVWVVIHNKRKEKVKKILDKITLALYNLIGIIFIIKAVYLCTKILRSKPPSLR